MHSHAERGNDHSLLAKVVNDNAPCLDELGALGFFASKLAPTGLPDYRFSGLPDFPGFPGLAGLAGLWGSEC